MRLTVILTPDEDDGGYVAECPAIPGCISEGDSVEEALANIKEAIEGCLESLVDHQQPLPKEGSVIVATIEADLPTPVSN
jgi:predicted RNase H-like HicB family nuclease